MGVDAEAADEGHHLLVHVAAEPRALVLNLLRPRRLGAVGMKATVIEYVMKI